MNALQMPLQWIPLKKNQIPAEFLTLSEHTQTNMEILIKLLRDVKLENRMETLIKAECLFDERSGSEPENFEVLIRSRLGEIREDLEGEIYQLRKMIFMLDQTETFFP